jgi:hypothetical protein
MKSLFTGKYILSVLILMVVCFFSVNIIKACSCIPPSLEGAIEDSSNIVILKLQSVEKYREDEIGYGIDGIKQSRLTVEKVFKGNLKVGQELIFSQGGGADCVWTFDEDIIGFEFLFFLGNKTNENNLWKGYVCSRSNTLKDAAADLMYLEKMSKVKGKTRLSGTVSQEDKPAVEGEKGSYNHLTGRTVTISGNGKNIKLKTDDNGVYEIYDLPVGKYKVTPEKIIGYKFDDDGKDSVQVEIESESLTEQDFEFTIDNSIGGIFRDSNGKPLKGVYLELLPARGEKAPYFYEGDATDENGVFEFKKIPKGTYVIVINQKNEISARQPFGTFYYPNKIKREEATEITIGADDHFKDLIITAPNTAETITISGVLLFDDGKPVFNEAVEFFNNIEDIRQIQKYQNPDSRVTTDENGRFNMRILKGQKGILFGLMSAYVGMYEKCPQLDNLIKAKGESLQHIETPVIQIEAISDRSEIEFKFPFSSCKKAKR